MNILPANLFTQYIIPYCDIDSLQALSYTNKYYNELVQPFLQHRIEFSMLELDSYKHQYNIDIHTHSNIYDEYYNKSIQNGFNDGYNHVMHSQYNRLFHSHINHILQLHNQRYNQSVDINDICDSNNKSYHQLANIHNQQYNNDNTADSTIK